jgi:Malectin domain
MERRFCFVILFCSLNFAFGQYEIIYAVNAGSDIATTDSLGIRYEADTTEGSVACSSSGRLKGVPIGDKKLYDRVQHANFGYGFNITDDGYYTIVFKFAECWTTEINHRLFDILLNERKVIENLDVYKEGGINTAYTENVRFIVCGGLLFLNDSEQVPMFNKHVRIDFVSALNRAVVNGIVVLKQTDIDVDLPKVLRPTKKTVLPFYECKMSSKGQPTAMGVHGPAYIFNIYGPNTFNIFHGANKTESISSAEL